MTTSEGDVNGILLFKIWLTTFLSAAYGEVPREERMIIPVAQQCGFWCLGVGQMEGIV